MTISISAKIRRYLDDEGEGTADEISESIGKTKECVVRICSSLIIRGELSKRSEDGRSVFFLAPWTEPTSDGVVESAMSRRTPLELAWMGARP